MIRRLLIACTLVTVSLAFAPPTTMTTTVHAASVASPPVTSLQMVDVSSMPDIASTGMLLAETEAWVQPLALVLDPFLNLLSFAMVRNIGATLIPCRFFVFRPLPHTPSLCNLRSYVE